MELCHFLGIEDFGEHGFQLVLGDFQLAASILVAEQDQNLVAIDYVPAFDSLIDLFDQLFCFCSRQSFLFQ